MDYESEFISGWDKFKSAVTAKPATFVYGVVVGVLATLALSAIF